MFVILSKNVYIYSCVGRKLMGVWGDGWCLIRAVGPVSIRCQPPLSPNCTPLQCTVEKCILLLCSALQCNALKRHALLLSENAQCTILHCTALSLHLWASGAHQSQHCYFISSCPPQPILDPPSFRAYFCFGHQQDLPLEVTHIKYLHFFP